jgi:A/G-specific adenine glycosylase
MSLSPPTLPQSAAPRQRLAAGAVLDWYDRHARLLPWRVPPDERAHGVRPDPYRIWLSEVMLQQTTIAAVGRYYARFIALWPGVADLAAAPLDAVLVEWAGLGYYARARNLHACAQAVVERHGGRFPETAQGLATLPGIGAYTSAAIAAICFDERVGVLDGNVERVMARYLALEQKLPAGKEVLRAALDDAVPARAGDFAQAMMDLGATICAPRAASCLLCPLEPGCAGRASGDPARYPLKAEKPERPTRYGHAFVIRRADGAVLLRQRAGKGLLAKMTETPGSEWTGTRSEVAFPFVGPWRRAGELVHVFTHFRLELDVWTVTVPSDVSPDVGWWGDPYQLDGEALPSLFRKVLAVAGLE